MSILPRFRRNRHHAAPQTQPRLTAPPSAADALTAEDWIDIQLLAHKTLPLESLASENRLAAGLWQWRFFITTEADRQLMARLEDRRLLAATDAGHTCACLTTRGVTQLFHLCRHVRLTQAPVLEHDKARSAASL